MKSLEKSFLFDVDGRILRIDSAKDAGEKLVWTESGLIGRFRPRFEPLLEAGFDAIHLTIKGERETRFHRDYSLYGWDCESVLVLNPDCIKLI